MVKWRVSKRLGFPVMPALMARCVTLRQTLLLLVVLFVTGTISPALAATCSDNSLIAADIILKRQLTALKNMERGRKCTAENAQGGFFNACRDLAQRRGDIQKQLQKSAAALAKCSGTSFTATPSKPSGMSNKGQLTKNTNLFGGQYSGTPLLFCVRLSDGYYFPAPHSQYARSDKIKETLAQCRFICETPDVNLYVLSDPAAETADMVSVDKRESYVNLGSAYAYQASENFQKCNWAKYFSYIEQVRAGSAKPKKKTIAPVKPVMAPVSVPVVEKDMSDRAVRIVGPAFLQDGNDMLVNLGSRRERPETGIEVLHSTE